MILFTISIQELKINYKQKEQLCNLKVFKKRAWHMNAGYKLHTLKNDFTPTKYKNEIYICYSM